MEKRTYWDRHSVDEQALSIPEKPNNTTPHQGQGKESEKKICLSRWKNTSTVLVNPCDDESSPACVASFARVSAAPYLTSLLPLTGLHCIFWNDRYFPYHLAWLCSHGQNRIRIHQAAIARFHHLFRRSLAPVSFKHDHFLPNLCPVDRGHRCLAGQYSWDGH